MKVVGDVNAWITFGAIKNRSVEGVIIFIL